MRPCRDIREYIREFSQHMTAQRTGTRTRPGTRARSHPMFANERSRSARLFLPARANITALGNGSNCWPPIASRWVVLPREESRNRLEANSTCGIAWKRELEVRERPEQSTGVYLS